MADSLKVALVTGAGSGIGRAVSHALMHDGYAVVLAGRRMEPLQETVDLAEADAARCLCVPTDVGKPQRQLYPGRADGRVELRTVAGDGGCQFDRTVFMRAAGDSDNEGANP
jgi:NAD(P)-dependent dehydrogenase (short-subunit alcohol dehydrogenase family)